VDMLGRIAIQAQRYEQKQQRWCRQQQRRRV
jgi:hypothetical protein